VSRWLARIGLLGTVLLFLWGEPAWGKQVIAAKTVVASLRAGEGFDGDDVVIAGHLDLGPLRRITTRFICRQCQFSDIRATDVVFADTVDLSGSSVGVLAMTSAVFTKRFICRQCRFSEIRATGVVFADTVDLSGSRVRGTLATTGSECKRRPSLEAGRRAGFGFEARADFSRALFKDVVNFQDADLNDADFVDTTFRSDALFKDTDFENARFDGAVFAGEAPFQYSCFRSLARFEDVDFRGPVDFGAAHFAGGAYVHDARYRAEALFSGVEFRGYGASFNHVTADRGLNFERSTFSGSAIFFTTVVCGDVISLAGASFPSSLAATDVVGTGLVVDLSQLDRLSHDTRRELLRLVEKGAKANGDYGLANEAFYQRQILRRHEYALPVRVADRIFYQEVAGYLVRPQNPLRILFALALLGSVARVVRRQQRNQPDRERRKLLLGPLRLGWHVLEETGATLKDAVPKRFGGTGGERIHGVELLAYRVLVVCALIGLWANPTLRQYIQLIR
jgi:uncharacterized protein YjbI with pentapeptide repeats